MKKNYKDTSHLCDPTASWVKPFNPTPYHWGDSYREHVDKLRKDKGYSTRCQSAPEPSVAWSFDKLPAKLQQSIERFDDYCWEWKGETHSRLGYPIFGQGFNTVSARTAVYEAYTDLAIASDERVYMECGEIGCLNPEHMRLGK